MFPLLTMNQGNLSFVIPMIVLIEVTQKDVITSRLPCALPLEENHNSHVFAKSQTFD